MTDYGLNAMTKTMAVQNFFRYVHKLLNHHNLIEEFILVVLSTVRPKYSLTYTNFSFFPANNMRVLWPHVVVICPDIWGLGLHKEDSRMEHLVSNSRI